MEVFKGVVRNQGQLNPGPPPHAKKSRSKKNTGSDSTFYRYLVLGMIVTDTPIPEFATKKGRKTKKGGIPDETSTFILGGETYDHLGALLAALPQLPPKVDIRGYRADQILMSLNEIA